MDLAVHLGVDDPDSSLRVAAREGWRRWIQVDTDLAVVAEVDDLPAWTCAADPATKNGLLAKLAALTVDDDAAVAALVWLLLPGGIRVADRLRDLDPDIDGLVAGQLWVEASRAHELKGKSIAAAVLRNTRRELSTECGVGDLAKRRDRVWAESIRVDQLAELEPLPDESECDVDPFFEIMELDEEAIEANAIDQFDAWLLASLAETAEAIGVPAHRGRMGLTSAAVIEEVGRMVRLSPRGIRRRATAALDRIAAYAAIRDDEDKLAAWKAQHPTCLVTAAEEMHLVLTDDDAYFIRGQDLAKERCARAAANEDPPPATA